MARNRILILSLMLTTACASRGLQQTTPPIPSVVAANSASLPARWRVTLDTRAVGAVETVLWFDWAASPHVTARSRAGALPVVVGRWRSLLARVLGADLGQGVLLHLREGRLAVRNDSLFLDGRLVSPVFRLRLHAHVTEQRRTGTLTTQAGEPAGRIEAVPFDGSLPLRGYADLIPRMKAAAAEHIYDPAIQERSEWTSFWERIGSRLRRAQDDPEALFAVYDAARGLKLSHFALLRAGNWREGGAVPRRSEPLQLRPLSDSVAHLRFRHFDRVTDEVDNVFSRITADDVTTLIIDLRGVPGVDLSAMSVAAHLLSEPVSAGTFVGRRWWRTNRVPKKADGDGLPVLASGEYDVDAFFRALRTHGAFTGRVEPRAPLFGGRVFVLVNRATSSAAEALAHVLAYTRRATLIGERTAGAMLSSEEIPLGDGWTLLLPTADFYTPDGKRIEGRGVEPDIAASSERALEVALGMIGGGSRSSMRRRSGTTSSSPSVEGAAGLDGR